MAQSLIIKDDLIISDEFLEVTAVRSSGPGGQNVNKVSTCVVLRFNPVKWGKLNSAALARLLNSEKNRMDSDGNIMIVCQTHREQYRNLEEAFSRLKEMIIKALKSPKKRKPTKPTKASIEKRIKMKKILSEKKANRKKLEI